MQAPCWFGKYEGLLHGLLPEQAILPTWDYLPSVPQNILIYFPESHGRNPPSQSINIQKKNLTSHLVSNYDISAF